MVTFKDHIPASEVEKYKSDYKKISEVLEYKLSHGGTINDTRINISGALNYATIMYTLLLVCAIVFCFYKLNKTTVDVPYERDSGYNLGGWTIVLGISIVIGSAMSVYNLFNSTYYLQDSYDAWKIQGGGLVFTAFAELTFYWLWALSSVAIACWYFMRRDIFPRMFVGYVTLLIVTQFILFLLYQQYATAPEYKDAGSSALKEIVRIMFYGAIWCTYVMKSERVKGTFLKAYQNS